MTMPLSLRSLRKTLLGACLVAAAGVVPLTLQAAEKLKIGTVVWAGYAPFYVADKLDLYKPHGLKVELQFFNDPALIPTAMTGGALDGGMLTYDQVVGGVAKGRPYRVVMPIDFSNGGDAIVADKSIKSVADFKGKKIGFNPLSPSDFLLAYALKSHGLSDKDVSPVNMTPEGIPGAMASGSLPVGVTYEPMSRRSSACRAASSTSCIHRGRAGPDHRRAGVQPGGHRQTPESDQRDDPGYADGLAYMKAHPDESAEIIGKVLGVSAAEAKEQMAGVYNIPLAEMGKNFEKSDATSSFFGSGAVIAQLLKDNSQIPAIPDLAQTFDAQFVQALAQ